MNERNWEHRIITISSRNAEKEKKKKKKWYLYRIKYNTKYKYNLSMIHLFLFLHSFCLWFLSRKKSFMVIYVPPNHARHLPWKSIGRSTTRNAPSVHPRSHAHAPFSGLRNRHRSNRDRYRILATPILQNNEWYKNQLNGNRWRRKNKANKQYCTCSCCFKKLYASQKVRSPSASLHRWRKRSMRSDSLPEGDGMSCKPPYAELGTAETGGRSLGKVRSGLLLLLLPLSSSSKSVWILNDDFGPRLLLLLLLLLLFRAPLLFAPSSKSSYN